MHLVQHNAIANIHIASKNDLVNPALYIKKFKFSKKFLTITQYTNVKYCVFSGVQIFHMSKKSVMESNFMNDIARQLHMCDSMPTKIDLKL